MALTNRHLELLRALGNVQWAPGHWLAHDVGRAYHPHVHADLHTLEELGLVERYKRNATKKEKHSVFSRTLKADKLLNEPFTRSKTSREHQILDDMWLMSLRFGVQNAKGFGLDTWPQILQHGVVDNLDTLKLVREGRNPHNIVMKAMPHALLYDQKGPLELFHNDDNVFLFHQTDRDTEQGRATEKSNHRQTWTWKIRHMLHFGKEKYWKSWYGFDNHFQTIVTVNETAKRLIKDIIAEESNGKCKFIGVAAWRDWGSNELPANGGEEKYPPIVDNATGKVTWPWDWAFTTAYERVGYDDFYLNRFWEMR